MAVESGKYSWKPEAVYRYESFWSLLHKMALWNFCSAEEILGPFGRGRGRESVRGKSLLEKQYLDEEKLSHGLHLSLMQIREGFVEHFLLKREIGYFAARNLRFCPECIRTGFHSVLHQFLFQECCPYHQKRLETACPSCQKEIHPIFTGLALEYCYSCPSCGYFLWKFNGRLEKKSEIKQRTLSFRYMAEILLKRKSRHPTTVSPKVWTRGTYNEDYFANLTKRLFGAWREVYGTEGKEREPRTGSKTILLSINKGEWNRNPLFNLISAYRTFLSKEIIGKIGYHTQCVQLGAKKGWWMATGHFFEKVTLCPWAQAYFFWRMYWEERDSAHGLFLPGTSREGEVKRVVWDDAGIVCSSWAEAQIFKLECTGTFLSALEMAFHQQTQRRISFPGTALSLSYIPYWEFIRCRSDKEEELFWYLRMAVPKLPRNQHFTARHIQLMDKGLDQGGKIFINSVRSFHPRP